LTNESKRKAYDTEIKPEPTAKPFDGDTEYDGPETPLGSLFKTFRQKNDLHYDNLDLDANLRRLEKIKLEREEMMQTRREIQ
jgi:hypothetical protein